jgi:hypothetical protein
MAEYPLRYSPAALKYLSQHADEINFVAGSLGISPLSVAAGIAREQTLESDYYAYDPKRVIGNPLFRWPETYYISLLSDEGIRDRYDAVNKLDNETLMNPQDFDKIAHPLLFDIGPGNIKLRTGISLLDNYNSQYQGNDDFMGLNKYEGKLPQFVSDLKDPKNPLTAKVSGLLAQEATQFYQQHMTPTAWNYLTDDQKAAAVTQYYVRGPEKLTQEAAGQEFWFPDFSKPGSSFYYYKDNADVLRSALGYNTYPPEVIAPKGATATIETSKNSPYNYMIVPSAPASDENAPNAYASQSQAAPAARNALVPSLRIGNALIGQTPAGAPANTLDPATLAVMVLNRTFGLPPSMDFPSESAAQQ